MTERQNRVNEFDVEEVLALFLPYHESPHFAKMLSILHIPYVYPSSASVHCTSLNLGSRDPPRPQSTFSFLLPFKSAASNLPRTALVTAMLSAPPLARVVANLLPRAHEGGYAHRTLLAFNIGVMHAYIVRAKSVDLDEGVVGLVLGALVDALKASGSPDPNVVVRSLPPSPFFDSSRASKLIDADSWAATCSFPPSPKKPRSHLPR